MIPLILLAAFVVFVVFLLIMSAIHQRAFNERFPPITDEEFLARCKPGTSPAVALRVRAIVAGSLGIDYRRIYPSSRFIEDLGAD